jgi:hypothetical protein
MPSLNDIFLTENNVVYVFLAITNHNVFIELPNRINKCRKTIFFMPDVSCFRNKNEKNKHRVVLKEWIEFVKKHDNEFIEFYLVKNCKNDKNRDCYSFLYSSLLAKNIVRFNIYKYAEDGTVMSREGDIIECKMNENSLYDIVERGYTDAWNERIGVRKINICLWIQRLILNHIYWLLFSILMLTGATIIFMIFSQQIFLGIFIPVMSVLATILSLLKQKITKIFYKKKLPF